jgi:hypothetical protein
MAVDHFTAWGPLPSVYTILSGTRQSYSHWSLFGRVVYGGELGALRILALTTRLRVLYTVGIDLPVIVCSGRAHE